MNLIFYSTPFIKIQYNHKIILSKTKICLKRKKKQSISYDFIGKFFLYNVARICIAYYDKNLFKVAIFGSLLFYLTILSPVTPLK